MDELNLHQYSNLPQWVARLDEEVERRLVVRLEAGIREWTRVLRGERHDVEVRVTPSFSALAVHRGCENYHQLRPRTLPVFPNVFFFSQAEDANDTHESQQTKNPLGGEPQLKISLHELRITNQQMHLHPSIEVAQQELMLNLGAWESTVLNLPRIQHSRYQVSLHSSQCRHLYMHVPNKNFKFCSKI